MIRIKRIYEPAVKEDGFRILVDRLWPRGLKKEEANIDLWMKEVAPSVALRKWFGHDPGKWKAFEDRYLEELARNESVAQLLKEHQTHPSLTLLYAAHDQQHNHAITLQKFLKRELG